MPKSFSIAEARHGLAALVHELEKKPVIELTRRGKPVAMLVSVGEYNRLRASATAFWAAYQAYCERVNLYELNIHPRIFKGVRDTTSGREIEL